MEIIIFIEHGFQKKSLAEWRKTGDYIKVNIEKGKKISKKLMGNKNGLGKNTGKHFYTNGLKIILAYECPEGFWKSTSHCAHKCKKEVPNVKD